MSETKSTTRWLVWVVAGLSLVAPSLASALVENGALIYREDFDGESAGGGFGPYTPEVDVLEGGSLGVSSITTGPEPVVVADVLRFELSADADPLGDQRLLQEAVVPFAEFGSPDPGSLGERSIGLRGDFTDASFPALNWPSSMGVAAGTFPGDGDSFLGVSGGVLIDFADGVPPEIELSVGFAETSFPGLEPLLTRTSDTPLSEAMRDAIVGGADFTVELLIDREAALASSALRVDGFAEIVVGPISIAELDRPLNLARAVVAYGAEPAVTLAGPSVGLDAFELRIPYARDFVVDRTIDRSDINPGNGACQTVFGFCTLRAAIQEANASPGFDRIFFAEPQTLMITRAGAIENAASNGDLDILDDVEILGLGVDQTIIDGAGADRVFDIPAAPVATIVHIADVSIQGGRATDPLEFQGGGIHNAGRLTLEGCRVTDNQASVGGGLLNRFRLIVDRCLIDANIAFGLYGFTKGGIGMLPNTGTGGPPITRIFDSAVVENASGGPEGGISVEGEGELLVRNTTVSGNTAFQIVAEDVDVTLDHATLGGPASLQVSTTGPAVDLSISNSALEGPCSASPGAVGVTFYGHNVASDASCELGVAGGLQVASLGLSPLLPMGPSRGHALLPGSPLVDTADASVCPAQDQVGTSRPLDGDADGTAACDVGAIEVPEPGFAIGLALGVGGLALVGRRTRARHGA